MAKLTASARKRLPSNIFGLPGLREYPEEDKTHAADAKSRAAQEVGKSITPSQKAQIDRKADRVLGK